MSQIKGEEENYYPLSSENKEIGWGLFIHHLPKFLKKRRPAKIELPIIHRLTTHGADIDPIPDAMVFNAGMGLLTLERPEVKTESDTAQILNNLPSLVRSRMDLIEARVNRNSNVVDKTLIRIRITLFRRGHLRQFGTRSINGSHFRPIHSFHLKPIYHPNPLESGYFVGLSTGLEETFNLYCDKSDEVLSEASTLDEKLEAIVFSQLIGCSIIHPFMDGNGRCFGAKLVLDLNRIGFDIKEVPNLPELKSLKPELALNALSTLGPQFLIHFLETNKIPLLNQNQVRHIAKNPEALAQYMTMLKRKIDEFISKGLPKEGTIEREYIKLGVFVIKLALSRDGYIDQTFYTTNIAEFLKRHGVSTVDGK